MLTRMNELPPITIDMETYFDKTYSLTKMEVIFYVRDPRFEVLGFAYMEDGQAAQWFSGDHAQTQAKLLSLDLHRREVRAHNAMFDGAILEWVFGIRPLRYLCSMMAARPFVVPFTGSASLEICAKFWQLPPKGDKILSQTIGVRRADLHLALLHGKIADYCRNDAALCHNICDIVLKQLPQDELDLIDLTIKKFLRGKLTLDQAALAKALDEILVKEAHTLLKVAVLGATREQIVSNQKFADLLIKRAVIAPTKTSPTTGKPTFAFSKKDPMFLALLKHPDPAVVQLVEARLLLKSSIERTRLQKFLDIGKISPTMPVPLLYYGAHTGRFSGMGGFNMQNLPKKTALRNALHAPPGHQVIVADLKAIEARITAVLAGETTLVQKFHDGVDVYTDFASMLFETSTTDITEEERFIGKMCILGLGFGMGATKFTDTMDSLGVPMDGERAAEIVATYREVYPRIPQLWRTLDKLIKQMLTLSPTHSSWCHFPVAGLASPMRVLRDVIELPNSMRLNYPELSTSSVMGHFVYRSFHGPGRSTMTNLWGGTLCENIAQALARIVLARAEVRLAKAGLTAVMQVHDELVFVVPEHTVPTVTDVIRRVLTDPVPWMPGLPLACTIEAGDSYGGAK